MNINPELIKLAEWRINEINKHSFEESAFVPPGDPSGGQGGGPPPGTAPAGDPSMGGGAPPMDPSMGGGDPSMGGGPVPGGGGLNADSIAQIVTQTMQQQGGGMGGGGMGGAAGGMGGKPVKANLESVAIDRVS